MIVGYSIVTPLPNNFSLTQRVVGYIGVNL